MAVSPRHFINLADHETATLRAILDYAKARKGRRGNMPKGEVDRDAPLAGHVLAMIFEKASTRTRISFDVGMRQMGGTTLVMGANDMQLGRGETVEDTAEVLSSMVDLIMIRANDHETVRRLAKTTSIPVINGLTNYNHPCQVMADILTIEEHRGPISEQKVAWIGDGNNMSASWISAAIKFGFPLMLGCPRAYAPLQDLLDWAKEEGADVTWTVDPLEAAAGATAVNTDTFVNQ